MCHFPTFKIHIKLNFLTSYIYVRHPPEELGVLQKLPQSCMILSCSAKLVDIQSSSVSVYTFQPLFLLATLYVTCPDGGAETEVVSLWAIYFKEYLFLEIGHLFFIFWWRPSCPSKYESKDLNVILCGIYLSYRFAIVDYGP